MSAVASGSEESGRDFVRRVSTTVALLLCGTAHSPLVERIINSVLRAYDQVNKNDPALSDLRKWTRRQTLQAFSLLKMQLEETLAIQDFGLDRKLGGLTKLISDMRIIVATRLDESERLFLNTLVQRRWVLGHVALDLQISKDEVNLRLLRLARDINRLLLAEAQDNARLEYADLFSDAKSLGRLLTQLLMLVR